MDALRKPAINTLIALTTAFSTPAMGMECSSESLVKNGDLVTEYTCPGDMPIPQGCEKTETFVKQGDLAIKMMCQPVLAPGV